MVRYIDAPPESADNHQLLRRMASWVIDERPHISTAGRASVTR